MALTQSERRKRYLAKPGNKEKCIKATNNWQAANREKRNAYMRGWWVKAKAANPEKYFDMNRRSRLKRLYGITPENYDGILAAQGGHCALCDKTPDTERHGYLHVDHCHETDKVRGLLCEQHNLALGKLGDSEQSLLKALEYIRGGI